MSESLKAVSGKDPMSQSAEVFIIICFNDGKAFLGPAQHNGLSISNLFMSRGCYFWLTLAVNVSVTYVTLVP